MSRGLDLRLVLPAVVCWASAGLLVAVPAQAAGAAAVFALLAIGVAVGAAVRGARSRRARAGRWSGLLVVCGAAAALTAMAVAMQAPTRAPEAVRTLAVDHAEVTARLTVWSPPVASGSAAIGGGAQVRFRATLTGLDDQLGLSVPVVVFTAAAGAAPEIGDEIELTGTLAATEPGDAATALLFARDGFTPLAAAPWWLDWANGLRHGFAAAAERLPGEGAGLLPGLAIGDTTAVDGGLDTAMKTSALSHLTAVSGANCAVVLALVLGLAAALGLGRTWRVVAGLAVLAGFVVLVTPEPSVLRAAVMATVVLLTGSIGRPGRGLPVLALTVLGLLITDPWLARNYGFALSVLATLGLLVLSGPLSRRLRRWLPAPISAVLAIPLAAQLACQPVLVLLSPTLPAYGVPANLLAAPAAPVATIVGLVACLVLPWLPGLAVPLVWLAWLPSTWIAAVAEAASGLPGSRLPWLGGPLGVALTVACTVAILALLFAGGRGLRTVVLRTVSGALLVVTVGCVVGLLVGTGLGRAAVFPAEWQIAACDVGQGDAVLVRGGGQVALVDVGPDPALLTDCLHTLAIDRVDLLILSHYDLDHVGGLSAVLGKVGTALVGEPENGRDAALHTRLTAGGAQVRQATRGDHGSLGPLSWEILWPLGAGSLMQTGNAGSVTVLFDGGGIRSLFLGDLGEEAQDALLAAGPIGRVDVVKVAHHGSRDQSAALYAQLGASVGLISVGADNGYGHPTRSLLDELGSVGTVAVRTDQDGLAVVAPTSGAPPAHGPLTVWTEKVGGAG